jgi:glutathione S-transferase
MRARLALKLNNIKVELREIELRNKPSAMLSISPKGTVPVLQLASGEVIDQSWDVMRWAYSQRNADFLVTAEMQALIDINDGWFKDALDHYKYPQADDINTPDYYRAQGEVFLKQLNERLTQHAYLMGDSLTIIDWAILPFIRQFAAVDKHGFDQSEHELLKKWLDDFNHSALFESIMHKYMPWGENADGVLF